MTSANLQLLNQPILHPLEEPFVLFVKKLLLKALHIMDGACSPCIPKLWDKSNVIVGHEAAASFFLPSCLPHISRKISLIEPPGDWAEDALNAAIEDSNDKSASSPCRFPRRKSRLRTANARRRAETDTEAPDGASVPVLRLSKVPTKDAREHSVLEWESRKDNIKQLYRDQGLTLEEVMEIMKRDYGFAATYVLLKSSLGSVNLMSCD